MNGVWWGKMSMVGMNGIGEYEHEVGGVGSGG